MKRPQILLAGGIASALPVGALAMTDHLTELAPVFLAGSAGSFAWRFWGGGRPSSGAAGRRAASPFGKAAKLLAVAGVLALGLSGLGLLGPSLEGLPRRQSWASCF